MRRREDEAAVRSSAGNWEKGARGGHAAAHQISAPSALAAGNLGPLRTFVLLSGRSDARCHSGRSLGLCRALGSSLDGQ